jgi:tetratricopeptide (TPR) repeat protein
MKLSSFIKLLPLVFLTTPISVYGLFQEKKESTVNNQELQSGNEEISKVKKHISEIFKNKTEFIELNGDGTGYSLGFPKEILVLEDRIEFGFKNQNKIIYFSDMLNYTFKTVETDKMTDDGKSVIRNASQIKFGNICLEIRGYKKAMELAYDLTLIQNQLNEKQYSSQLLLFEPIATQYRILKVKPSVSEEQRKYIVQANSFNQQKEYSKAIELYIKAIEIDQTAYSSAYSNIALLSAQINKFSTAIYYMKKYLLLEPDASEARSAQDKIYEWEAHVTK